jgi:uncharacterized protein (DUF433 family)
MKSYDRFRPRQEGASSRLEALLRFHLLVNFISYANPRSKYCRSLDCDRLPKPTLKGYNSELLLSLNKLKSKGVQVETTMGARHLGRFIVADPKICHGKPTFRGTRVLVSDVLDQVANGMAWEMIIEDWNDSVSIEAIKEAVQLASQALLRHADEFALEQSAA